MKLCARVNNFLLRLLTGTTPTAGRVMKACALVAGVLASCVAGAQTDLGSVDLASSATSTVTVTVATAGTLASIAVVTQGVANLDFTNAGGGSCAVGTAYAAQATCTVNVAFAPRFAGERYGAVVLTDANNNVIATAYLQGMGTGPQTIFRPGSLTSITKYNSVNNIFQARGIAVDGAGNIYVSSAETHSVYELTLSNGTYTESLAFNGFEAPYGVAVDGAGNLYVADFSGSAVYKETLANGNYARSVAVAGLKAPYGVAVDSAGNLYVTESIKEGSVFKETLANGTYTQAAIGSGFVMPTGVAVDASGDVFVTDITANIYMESPSGGAYTQSTIGAGLKATTSVATDAAGNVYVGGLIGVFELSPSNGSYTQSLVSHGVEEPSGLALDGASNLFVSNLESSIAPVVKIGFASPPALNFGYAPIGSTGSTGPQTALVANYGNSPLTLSAISFPADFPEQSGVSGECSTAQPVPGGSSCTLTIGFAPVTPVGANAQSTLAESVSVTSDTLNISSGEQQAQFISVSGVELKAGVTMTLTVSASSTTVKSPVTLAVSMMGISGFPAPAGSVQFTCGSKNLGTVALAGGQAMLTTTALPAGADSVAATYLGDSIYGESATSPVSITVNKFKPAVALGSSSAKLTIGDPGTFTATVTGISEQATPAGTVTFFDGAKPLGTVFLVKGEASLTTRLLPAGRDPVTGEYSGDPLYAGVTSASVIEVIDKKGQSIEFSPVPAARYGESPRNLDSYARSSSGLAVSFKLVSGPGVVHGSEVGFIGAGMIEIEAYQSGDGAYSAAEPVRQRITVAPATLTVIANSLTMNEGAQVPTLTYKITGFVRDDTRGSATRGDPELSTTATPASSPGPYPIVVKIGHLTAKNYKFKLKDGTLTVK
jgi:streptogramin lyase